MAMPFVVVLVAVVVQVSLLARDRARLVHAAREAIRTAMVEGPSAAVSDARAATGLDVDRLDIAVEGGRAPGERVVVTVRYRAPTDVAIVGSLLPDVVMEERLVSRRE
jgi:hypothetical protein